MHVYSITQCKYLFIEYVYTCYWNLFYNCQSFANQMNALWEERVQIAGAAGIAQGGGGCMKGPNGSKTK